MEKCFLNDLTNKYYFKSQFYEFNAVGTQSLPIIYQSGYLTIKTYDPENEVYTLDFPNEEVERGFVSLVAISSRKRLCKGIR